MILTATTDKLQVITDAAASVKIAGSYVRASGSPYLVTEAKPIIKAVINSATTTDVWLGPGSGASDSIPEITFFNDHASQTVVLTAQVTDGTNTDVKAKCTLLAGERLEYAYGVWTHYDVNGGPYAQNAKLDVKLRVVSDVTNATTSFADVTGLTVALKANRNYSFEARLVHINNATTTGSRFGVNIGAAPTNLIVSAIDTVTNSATASTHSAGSTGSLDTATSAQTTGSATNALCIMSGSITPSADGTFAIRCQSEVAVASGLIVKAGSWLRIWENDN